MKGVCSGGHPLTAEAGLRAFEAGGNAIDAAVAAQLYACVTEPLLTGLGGGGIALVRHKRKTKVLDFFSDMPGLARPKVVAPLEILDVDFGPTTQRFSIGVSSVATPSMIFGLWELHKVGGVLPLPTLARWAADLAEKGLEVSEGLAKSIDALGEIIAKDEYLAPKLMMEDGTPAPAGHRYALPELSETLMRWAEGGPQALLSGAPLDALIQTLTPYAPLSRADLAQYKAQWRDPLHYRTPQGANIYTPSLPSQGGVQLITLLHKLIQKAEHLSTLDPLSAQAVLILGKVMEAVEQEKGPLWPAPLLESSGRWRSRLGFTTHISVSDEEGTNIGITSSLGETAGTSVASLGLILNNFLGEEDVAPPHCTPKPGERLFTMCTPTMLDYHDQRWMLGSGGSSRIRSVLMHGISYLLPELLGTRLNGDSPECLAKLVCAPRSHFEMDSLRVETLGRLPNEIEKLQELWHKELVTFEGRNLYFGGLHISSEGRHGVFGAGDPRRSGHARGH